MSEKTSGDKRIYIVHQYGEESHFKALYDCADEYGFSVSGQIILSKKAIVFRFLRKVRDKKVSEAFHLIFGDIRNRKLLNGLYNQILIIGIAPYDYRLNRYQKIWSRNQCYYFTSCTEWDGSTCSVGSLKNKEAFEAILRNCFKGAFCVSQASADAINRIIANRVVVNHAVNINEYKSDIRFTDTKKIIFVGGFVKRKNIQLILNWLDKNRDICVEMYFAGSGELEGNINDFSEKDSRVHNLGRLEKTEIKASLCKYDYLILPSKNEPFGIVLVEALASGLPCIVSNASGPIEVIEDGKNGFVFDLQNEEASFDNVMKKAIGISEKEYIKMANQALASSKKYNSTELIKRWMKLIENEGTKCNKE